MPSLLSSLFGTQNQKHILTPTSSAPYVYTDTVARSETFGVLQSHNQLNQKIEDISKNGAEIKAEGALVTPPWAVVRAMYNLFPEVSQAIRPVVNYVTNYRIRFDGEINKEATDLFEKLFSLHDLIRACATDKLIYGTYILSFAKTANKTKPIKLLNVSPAETSNWHYSQLELDQFTWNSLTLHASKVLKSPDFFVSSDTDSQNIFFGTSPLANFYTKLDALSRQEDDYLIYWKNSSQYGVIVTLKDGSTQEHAAAIKSDFLNKVQSGGRFTASVMSGVEKVQTVDQRPPQLFTNEDKMYLQELLYSAYNVPIELYMPGKGGSNLNGSEKTTVLRQKFKEEAVDPIRTSLENDFNHTILPTALRAYGISDADIKRFTFEIPEMQPEPTYLKLQRAQLDAQNGFIPVEQYVEMAYNQRTLPISQSLELTPEKRTSASTLAASHARVVQPREIQQTVASQSKNSKSFSIKKKQKRDLATYLKSLDSSLSSVDQMIAQGAADQLIKTWKEILDTQVQAIQKSKQLVPLSSLIDARLPELADQMLFLAKLGSEAQKQEMEKLGFAKMPDVFNSHLTDIAKLATSSYVSSQLASEGILAVNKKVLSEDVAIALAALLPKITHEDGDYESLLAYLVGILTPFEDGLGLDTTLAKSMDSTGTIQESYDTESRAEKIGLLAALAMLATGRTTTAQVGNPKKKVWLRTVAKNPSEIHLQSVGQEVAYNANFVHVDGSQEFWSQTRAGCLCDVKTIYKSTITNYSQVKTLA